MEGDAGTSMLTFDVTLSNASYLPVSMDFATMDGTATIADSDYVASSGNAGGGTDLVIPPGSTLGTLDVTINGDVNLELDENFTMMLSNAINGTLNIAVGTGTILTDGSSPNVAPPQPDFMGFDKDEIGWTSVPTATSYHLYRGDLEMLKSTGVYTQTSGTVIDAKQFCWVAGMTQTDTYEPAPGRVLFYLVTTDDGMLESKLGSDGDGSDRPNDNACR